MPRRPSSRPSLLTVAQGADVSTATVSNVFNRPDRVSAEVRRRVLAEAERQGYSGPDPVARQLSRGRTETVGLLLTGELPYAFGDPAAVQFLQGFAQSCQTAELNLLMISAESTSHRPAAVANAVVDGFVVYSVRRDDPHLEQILKRNLPTVVVDSPRDLPGVDWVGPDDRAGMRALGEYLVALGHRSVAALAVGPVTGSVTANTAGDALLGLGSVHTERLAGLQEALRAAGVDDFPVEIRPENTVDDGVSATRAVLDRHPDTTAVCGLTDLLALGALQHGRQRGLSIPHRLSITGFDDIPRAEVAGLTTVRQPLLDKGRIAGELYLSHRAGLPARRRTLPTHVVIRSSSGSPER